MENKTKNPKPYPAMRALDVIPVRHRGQNLFYLKDMDGLTQNPVVLTKEQFFIAACLDGKSGPQEIQTAFSRQFGRRVLTVKEIDDVVRLLDGNFLLLSPNFEERLRRVRAEYGRLKRRPTVFAGLSYKARHEALEAELDGYFKKPGPGKNETDGRKELLGLVAPHIDFPRGGWAYAWAYREILSRAMADLYVVFGVAHAGPPVPLVLGTKDYETPFGPVAVDDDLAESLARAAGTDLTEHEFFHRREHSIEFQAVWLAYAAKKLKKEARILPILCSSFTEEDGTLRRVEKTLDHLAKLLKNYPGRICLLAGADFAHIGPRFGDAEPVAELLPWMKTEDAKSIDRLLEKNAPGFFVSVMAEGGKRKVCGSGCLYAFTWLLKRLHPEAQGKLLKYGHAPDPAGGEVSFASMAFTEG
ncbi:MAG: AmmeMemoRadiSam system protein B [Elusimicrobia bacterium]|nr:AmmeMemoRadiSam system protein B [Elusimicrobiota bacterium]